MRCVRALVQKLCRSAKPEKLENHHSLLQRLRCFCCCCRCVNSCNHRCFADADRAHADRADRPVAKEARELQRGRSRLKQRYQTMPDPLLHPSLVLVAFPLSSISISTVDISTSPLLFVLGPSFSSSSSFSFFFSCTHTPSFLASLLSPCLNPRQPPLTVACIMITMLSHIRCTTLAATPSLPHPRWSTLVAPPSLPHPRCLTLAAPSRSNLSPSHPPHC